MNRLIRNSFHAGAKDVGANGSGVGGIGGRGKTMLKKVMLGKIINAVCKRYLSPQIMLLIFFSVNVIVSIVLCFITQI